MHNVTEEPGPTLSARPINVIITDRTNEEYTIQLGIFQNQYPKRRVRFADGGLTSLVSRLAPSILISLRNHGIR